MKKLIKILSFIFLILVLTIVFNDRAYAANKKPCEEYNYELWTCPNNKVDSQGYICTMDVEGHCARLRKAKNCSDYTSDEICPRVSETEHVCGINTSDECVKMKKAYACGEGDYTKGNCPQEDDYGNTCQQDQWGCQIVKYAPEGAQASKVYECGDYSISDCKGTDSFGNTCSPNKAKTKCIKSTEAPVEEEVFTCEEYDTDNGKKKCPLFDSYNRSCDKDYSTGRCYHPTGGKVYDKEEIDEVIKTKTLVEADEEFVCSDVEFLSTIWLVIRIVSPFLVVIFGSLDFFKAVIASDEKMMKQARGKLPKRIIAFILLILLPFVIQLIFEVAGTHGSENMCLVKCIATHDTSSTTCK